VPSISNYDDARSIRYAYGGQDGYVQKAGNELSYTVNGNTFRINSGVVVLQGWESEIDSSGWTMTVDNVATKRFYSVYYEVNLAMQTTEIKSVYDTVDYPQIEAGDDLTALQTGTARLLLYQFTAQNGEISDVSKKVNAIRYTKEEVRAIDERINIINVRLTKLGFRQGSATLNPTLNGSATQNIFTRQGNYVIGNLYFESLNGIGLGDVLFSLPTDFCPKEATKIVAYVEVDQYGSTIKDYAILTIPPDGKVLSTIVFTLKRLEICNIGFEALPIS